RTSVFVQDVHGFLQRYGGTSTRRLEEHIFVYDEAQRAWDQQQATTKGRHPVSEPEDFLRIGSRQPDWAMMVALIGEGQEIYVGEGAGLGQWDPAIDAVGGGWHVHCAERVRPVFQHAGGTTVSQLLDLSESLRSHIAEDVHRWAAAVIEGRFSD